jgi:predicted MPP superfamily phosphohydrolase
MYTIHKPPTTSQQQKKSQTANFYLLDKDFVDESTSKEDMEILFKQLKRLTKVAPVYFVYGNHENKKKFTKNKLNHEITKNNIIILNDQEVHLNNIILICRKDYTNKKPKEYNLTTKTYNVVLDHQPQGTKENIKNNVDLNSADILITDKCFHSLILTIYSLTLPVITAKKHSSTAQKSLVQALWVGVFL